jgi:hypothetical protein
MYSVLHATVAVSSRSSRYEHAVALEQNVPWACSQNFESLDTQAMVHSMSVFAELCPSGMGR